MKCQKKVELHGKSIYRFSVGLFLILTMSANIFSQNSPILDEFSAAESNGTVYLYWIITSGSTCDGIKIFRSADNLNFIQIGEIGGVCGNSSAPQPYNFLDEHPEQNSTNYYRLELGSTGYSKTILIEIIDLKDNGYQVRPNPVADKAYIFFENNLRNRFSFVLYNLNVQPVGSLYSNDDYFNISTINLNNGMYFFIISSGDKLIKIKGKILVKH